MSFLTLIKFIKYYTAQKQVIKYQKEHKNKKFKIKNNINLISKHFLIFLMIFLSTFKFFSCLTLKILFSERDNCFNIILITAEIVEEYNI